MLINALRESRMPTTRSPQQAVPMCRKPQVTYMDEAPVLVAQTLQVRDEVTPRRPRFIEMTRCHQDRKPRLRCGYDVRIVVTNFRWKCGGTPIKTGKVRAGIPYGDEAPEPLAEELLVEAIVGFGNLLAMRTAQISIHF